MIPASLFYAFRVRLERVSIGSQLPLGLEIGPTKGSLDLARKSGGERAERGEVALGKSGSGRGSDLNVLGPLGIGGGGASDSEIGRSQTASDGGIFGGTDPTGGNEWDAI